LSGGMRIVTRSDSDGIGAPASDVRRVPLLCQTNVWQWRYL